MAKEAETKEKKTAAKTAAGKSPAKKADAAKKPTKKADAPKKTARKTTEEKPVKKTTSPKKAPPKKEPSKALEPEAKPFLRKRTIAEKTVAWKSGKTAFIMGWLAIIPLVLMIVFFSFFMAGYSFTVLVCCGLICIILFYNSMYLLQQKNPAKVRSLKRMVTTILCIGLILVGITEFFILKASFGEPKESCDYAVVLGAKVRPTGPSASLWDRIYGARDYLETHPNVIAIVSGGQGPDEPKTEARAMYDELVKLGIDPDRIWLEEEATSTWENLNFSLNLIEEKTGHRPEKIGIVSSEYHLFRASLFADACNVESVGIPAHTSRLSQKINHFMREVAGVWHYLILGGQYQ